MKPRWTAFFVLLFFSSAAPGQTPRIDPAGIPGSLLICVAIDQHFTQRKRLPEMSQLMKTYPQYLGIGIDEATALIVKGSTADVIGKGKVHFYNTNRKVEKGQPDYEAVSAGGRYDLKVRKVVTEK